ncbi:methyltransferase domain-containing protein [Candidatus Omnitrophota bacterium]
MIDKAMIERNFSRYARSYDKYAIIQEKCAYDLISKVRDEDYYSVLEVGCGTGNFTKLLREYFPSASLRAVDISAKMIEVAKEKLGNFNIDFIVDDAESLSVGRDFNLITSNVSIQWFGNLESTLSFYKHILSQDATVLVSVYGPGTFCELRESLKKMLGDEVILSSSYFYNGTLLKDIFSIYFPRLEIDYKMYSQEFESLLDLLRSIKYTGTSGIGVSGAGDWTKGKIEQLEEVYKSIYGKIVATSEVFFVKARR